MLSNIILIGFRGSGKTEAAKSLSKKLGFPVLSTDKLFEKAHGDIGKFVAENGWKLFRKLESKIIHELNAESSIIDCGGGIVENSRNMEKLKENGIVFWLKADSQTIIKRLKNNAKNYSSRPPLTGHSFKKEIRLILRKRSPLYKKFSDFEINTSRKSADEAASEIISMANTGNNTQICNTKICAVIAEISVDRAIKAVGKAKGADIVELRLDFIKDLKESDLKTLRDSTKKEVIATCRPKNENGLFEGSEKERIYLLKKCIDLGFDFVDIEFGAEGMGLLMKYKGNKKAAKIILSYHDFKKTDGIGKLESIYKKMKKLNPDLVKIATFANSINDNFRIFRLLNGKSDLAAFCMGIKGVISRVLAPKFGSRLTYASVGAKTAEGQLQLEEMRGYNITKINPKTKIIGVIAEFAENSMSKYMHNACFRKLGLDFVYLPFKTKPEELKQFMENFRKFRFHGASVTLPHKESVIKYIDKLEDTAREIGAVNTLVAENGKITGYNTDYTGAISALKEKTEVKGRKVLLIGAGGGARAIVYGLKKEGAIATVANRSLERAQKLASEFNVNFKKMPCQNDIFSKFSIIINATSVGMSPNSNQSILNEEDIPKGDKSRIIMDIVYKPVHTKLMQIAEKAGCTAISGERMLIHQAMRQFELWTGRKADFKEMERELLSKI